MEKPLHIQLLEDLYKEGIGVYKNISPFFTKIFTKPLTKDTMTWREEIARHDLFIEDLVIREFIVNKQGSDDSQLPFEITDQFKWFDEIPVRVYITSSGLDYLDQYEQTHVQADLNKSYKDVNNASIKNYRNQIIIGAITICLAASSAYMSYQSNHKADKTAISVDSLRLEIQKWRKEKTQTPIQVALPKSVPHK